MWRIFLSTFESPRIKMSLVNWCDMVENKMIIEEEEVTGSSFYTPMYWAWTSMARYF